MEDNCPDVGVAIQGVETGENTDIEIFVTREEADMEVELYDSGSLVDTSTLPIRGREEVTLQGTGDRAVVSPPGCEEPRDEETF